MVDGNTELGPENSAAESRNGEQAVDLLGVPPGQSRTPELGVPWQRRRDIFWSSLRAAWRGPKSAAKWPNSRFFGNGWVRPHVPKRAMVASVAWHVLLINVTIPLGRLVKPPEHELAVPRIELTWYGRAQDLEPLVAPGPTTKPSPPGEPQKPLPPRGADAVHPRQTILSIPVKPTHPTQTLIQPDALPQPPKMLPQLPNVVSWPETQQPKLAMPANPAALSQPRLKRPVTQASMDAPVPELVNQETKLGPLNIASSPLINQEPRMPVNPGALPTPSVRRDNSQSPAAAPEIGGGVAGNDSGLKSLIALSPSPGSELPAPLPAGNVSAKFTASPEGDQPGVPGVPSGGTPGATGGAHGGPGSLGGTGAAGGKGIEGPGGIAISSANREGARGSEAGGGHAIGESSTRPLPAKLLPLKPESRPGVRVPPRSESSETIVQPLVQQVLGTDHVYTLLVNMPNFTSAIGSWVLNFAEMGPVIFHPRGDPRAELTGPLPLRKVDPKYPPELVSEHVQGEVVLYAIIRSDGSVDSMRVVKGLDPKLDQNAMDALGRWKFRPASKQGQPIDVAAIVTIPFRAVSRF